MGINYSSGLRAQVPIVKQYLYNNIACNNNNNNNNNNNKYKTLCGRSNITCNTNGKYRTAATLHALGTWFVSGI
jgi:hypothetical protein